eukprot:TRINITY_DN2387_c0_g1_i7.p1 TRINITY_DN2387_c0_g1~~TRINITY_DN2387_c0_g1_i7.p1  ORF type:complete len:342 (+),score=46.12 TRINITY_DN2387_c0_g1_i7:190-1215(+)
MMRLYQQQNCRILLIPNCAVWLATDAYAYLRGAFEVAFANDEEILQKIALVDFSCKTKVVAFLNDVASYLTNMNLMLIVSVDQYNNLRKNIIADHPFVVITCLAEDNQYTSVRVVITSSTSHFIPGEIPKNPLAEWRTFVWYEGLTAQEFASWCDRYRIPFRSTVAELTGRYPMELQRARDIIETAKPSSPLLFSQLYIRQTKQYLETKTGEFLSAGIKLQIPNFLELAATPALLVGSKIKIGNIPVRFMDERFFFIDNEDEVQALTPTFAKILATYWASVLRHDPVHPTLLNILQSDRKCAVALRQIQKSNYSLHNQRMVYFAALPACQILLFSLVISLK